MSRIQAVDPDLAEARTKALLAAVRSALGAVPNLFRVTAASPAALDGLLGLNAALAKGTFAAALRERIALAVAEANGCGYCLSAHAALGKGAGLTDAQIDAARDARADDARSAAILRFARSVVDARGAVSAAALDEVRRAGASDGEIVETIANVAVNVFTNYVNLVAETEVDFPRVTPRLAKAA